MCVWVCLIDKWSILFLLPCIHNFYIPFIISLKQIIQISSAADTVNSKRFGIEHRSICTCVSIQYIFLYYWIIPAIQFDWLFILWPHMSSFVHICLLQYASTTENNKLNLTIFNNYLVSYPNPDIHIHFNTYSFSFSFSDSIW